MKLWMVVPSCGWPKKHQGDCGMSLGCVDMVPQAQPLETSLGKIFWHGTDPVRVLCTCPLLAAGH